MQKLNRILFLSLTLFFISTIHSFDYKKFTSLLKEGDIIFQETRSIQARAIKKATKSRYTHVALIFKKKNRWYVFEAVQPVTISKLKNFIRRSVKKHFVVKRLKNREKYLTKRNILKLKKEGRKYLGKKYDLYFEWDDRRIYCSELVWKMFYRVLNIKVGKLEKLKDFDLSSSIVKKLLRKRYGRYIPLNEIVISPVSMFDSDLLKTIYTNN